MPTLLLTFPAGRYHATPWGHHVNEGLVEWPPSPWRILRALIATGYAKRGWSAVPDLARTVLERLASEPPRYRLPRCSQAHSRHFMPLGRLEQGREKTTLVFDTWANVGDGVLAITWDLDLREDQQAELKLLTEDLGYLGRAESWVRARLAEKGEGLPDGDDVRPCQGSEQRDSSWEVVSVLAPEAPATYTEWRRGAVAEHLERAGVARGAGKREAGIERLYPADVIACLQAQTTDLQKDGWSQPPGTRKVTYWRRADSLTVIAGEAARRATVEGVECVLLALASQSGNAHATPTIERTLPQAELIHRSLVSLVNAGGSPDAAGEIVGRDPSRRPLKGHRHAHLLPLDLNRDGHLDHVLIWAPMGLGLEAQAAIRKLRKTYAKGVAELRLAVSAVGDLGDIRRLPGEAGAAMESVLGPPGGGLFWRSKTPFVPPRHLKARGANSLQGQLHAELASRGLPPASVELVSDHSQSSNRFRHFVRARSRGGAPPPGDVGFALHLRFDAPVTGPLTLGYGSHFGLGRFDCAAPEPSRPRTRMGGS